MNQNNENTNLLSIFPLLSYFDLSILEPQFSPHQGRYVRATTSLKAGELVLVARGYANGVFPGWKKRHCDVCWRQCNDSGYTLHCKLCRQVFFCSKECEQLSTANIDTVQELLQEIQSRKCSRELIMKFLYTIPGYVSHLPSSSSNHNPFSTNFLNASSLLEFDRFLHPPIDIGCHQYECEHIRRISNSNMNKDNASMIRTLLRAMTKAKILQMSCINGNNHLISMNNNDNKNKLASELYCHLSNPTDFNLLCTVEQSISYFDEVKREFRKLFQSNSFTIDELLLILNKTESNAFSVYNNTINFDDFSEEKCKNKNLMLVEVNLQIVSDGTIRSSLIFPKCAINQTAGSKEKIIGRAVYPTAAYFNHSCQPNCEVHIVGSCMFVYTSRDVKKDDELAINYIDIELPRSIRQDQLKSSYGFLCQCKVCEEDLNSHAKHPKKANKTDKKLIKKKR